jgi:hypothetical protein
VGAFLAHGFINEEAEALGEAAGAGFIQELQNGIQEFRPGGVGHVSFVLEVFCDTPTGNPLGPPSTSFLCAERLPPSGGAAGAGRKSNLQKQIYTNLMADTNAFKTKEYL